jgi:hypothetical protein
MKTMKIMITISLVLVMVIIVSITNAMKDYNMFDENIYVKDNIHIKQICIKEVVYYYSTLKYRAKGFGFMSVAYNKDGTIKTCE